MRRLTMGGQDRARLGRDALPGPASGRRRPRPRRDTPGRVTANRPTAPVGMRPGLTVPAAARHTGRHQAGATHVARAGLEPRRPSANSHALPQDGPVLEGPHSSGLDRLGGNARVRA